MAAPGGSFISCSDPDKTLGLGREICSKGISREAISSYKVKSIYTFCNFFFHIVHMLYHLLCTVEFDK